MKVFGVRYGYQYISHKPVERNFTELEKFLLKEIKPKHREEAMQIWSKLKTKYSSGYNMDLTRGNNHKLMARAFSYDGNAIYAVESKKGVRPIAFMRRLEAAFDNLFSGLRSKAYKQEEAGRFVDALLK